MKILKIVGKVVFAPVLFCVFLLARLIQVFLKFFGAVVTFVCILSAVVMTIGVATQIILQIQGKGPGIPGIIVSVLVAGVLAYVPAAGVGMVMVVLEGACGWILRLYKGALDSVHLTYKKPDYRWADYEWDHKGPSVHRAGEGTERKIHYFKGIHTREELKKRAYALLKIYQPDNEFGEDEITRSIMDEYEYLRERLPGGTEEDR